MAGADGIEVKFVALHVATSDSRKAAYWAIRALQMKGMPELLQPLDVMRKLL